MNRVSSFIRVDADERIEREFLIAHTSKRRFGLGQILPLVVFGLICLLSVAASESGSDRYDRFGEKRYRSRSDEQFEIIAIASGVITAVLALYFGLRQLKISYGYAALTDRRLIYYEYCDHEAVNYHFVKTLYLAEMTAAAFTIKRSFFSKSFAMAAYTDFKALVVGAEGNERWWKVFGRAKPLQPGPDALEFIQYVTGVIGVPRAQAGSSLKASQV
jgi:hypothetical protein